MTGSSTILSGQISDAVENWSRDNDVLFAVAASWVKVDKYESVSIYVKDPLYRDSFSCMIYSVVDDYHMNSTRRSATIRR